jgi:uncharacterized protein YuzE
MQVRIGRHALLRALKRGVSLIEIEEVLASGHPVRAAMGRLAREKVFPFQAVWLGRSYAQTTDVLYLLLDAEVQQVRSQELSEDLILDLGPDDRIVGIEILDASKRVRLERLLPVEYHKTA